MCAVSFRNNVFIPVVQNERKTRTDALLLCIEGMQHGTARDYTVLTIYKHIYDFKMVNRHEVSLNTAMQSYRKYIAWQTFSITYFSC